MKDNCLTRTKIKELAKRAHMYDLIKMTSDGKHMGYIMNIYLTDTMNLDVINPEICRQMEIADIVMVYDTISPVISKNNEAICIKHRYRSFPKQQSPVNITITEIGNPRTFLHNSSHDTLNEVASSLIKYMRHMNTHDRTVKIESFGDSGYEYGAFTNDCIISELRSSLTDIEHSPFPVNIRYRQSGRCLSAKDIRDADIIIGYSTKSSGDHDRAVLEDLCMSYYYLNKLYLNITVNAL